MKTILEVLNLSCDFLKKKGINHARRQSEDLLSDALNLNRIELYTNYEKPLSEDELDLCRQNLARRSKGEPLQYIKGHVDFYGCDIQVNPNVLIPRQETEIFVDMIAKQLAKDELEKGTLKGKVLFDVCTGSGCIGISLKKKFPDLTVFLSDLSIDALKIAKENATKNSCEVECLIGNLLEPFKGKKCDYFICNPPYVTEKEYESLDIEVKNYEPKLALVGGDSGYEFYERLAVQLSGYLKLSAKGFFEIGRGQGAHILSLFKDGPYVNCQFKQDWSSHDRFFLLEIE